MTDFGADEAFAKVPNKLQEHYGINMSSSTIRQMTLSHGERMSEEASQNDEVSEGTGVEVQIGQIDDSMIPIMTPTEDSADKRKKKELNWQEGRLTLVHEKGNVSPEFSATFLGDVNAVGKDLKNSAIRNGFGSETQFHRVGDGAVWIVNQVTDKFGSQG